MLQLSMPEVASDPLQLIATWWLYQPFESGARAGVAVTVGAVASYLSGNAAVVVVRDFRRRLGEYQAADVLDAVVADSQRYEVPLPVNRDRSDLMVSADGDWRHCIKTAAATQL